MAVGKGLIRGAAWTAVHVMISVPLAFVVNVVVARRLGVVDYGELAVLTMILTVATTTASLGVGAALLQFSTKAFETDRARDVSALVRRTQGYNLLVAAPLVSLVIAFFVDVPWPFLVLAIAFGIFGPALFQVGPVILAASQRSDRAAQLAILSNAVVQGAVMVTAIIQPSPKAVWIARIVTVGAMMVLPFLALPRPLRRAALAPRPPWGLPRQFWIFALPTGAATLVSTLVTDRVQVLALQWLARPEAVGLFALAFGLAGHILTPVQAAVGPLVPAVSALTERGAEAARAGMMRITRISAVSTGAVVVAGVPLFGGLIPLIYGRDFAPAADLFVVMACSAAVVIVSESYYASMMARLQGGRYLRLNLLALLTMLVVAVVAIPPAGAWGAVASVVAGTLVRALSMVVIEARHHGMGPGEIGANFLPVLLAGAITLVVWFLVTSTVTLDPWAVAMSNAGIATVLYLVGIRVTRSGVRRVDRDMLLSAMPGGLRLPLNLVLRALSS